MKMNTPSSSFPDLRLAEVSAHRGRHLPQWQAAGAVYHVAFHLADSIPQAELAAWREIREELDRKAKTEGRELTSDERQLLRDAHDARIERYLSAGYGACLLRDRTCSQSVEKTLLHGNGVEYALHLYAIMPNHVHVIVGGFESQESFGETIAAWKRVSAHGINRACGRTGPVWMNDAYTRIIRNADEYRRQLSYVWLNPETAGLREGFRRQRFVTW